MVLSAARKMELLRALYEEWGVPPEILRELSSCGEIYFYNVVRTQEWKAGLSAVSLHRKFMRAFEEQLKCFEDYVKEEECPEKRSKVLSALTKPLESIVASNGRLQTQLPNTALDQDEIRWSDDNSNETVQQRTARLDQQLEELVKGLS